MTLTIPQGSSADQQSKLPNLFCNRELDQMMQEFRSRCNVVLEEILTKCSPLSSATHYEHQGSSSQASSAENRPNKNLRGAKGHGNGRDNDQGDGPGDFRRQRYDDEPQAGGPSTDLPLACPYFKRDPSGRHRTPCYTTPFNITRLK